MLAAGGEPRGARQGTELQPWQIVPPLPNEPERRRRTLRRPERPAGVLLLYSSFEMEPKAEPSLASASQMESVTEGV